MTNKQVGDLFGHMNIINLVVRRLNAYVGKERIHCFSVVRPVAMTQMQLSPKMGVKFAASLNIGKNLC